MKINAQAKDAGFTLLYFYIDEFYFVLLGIDCYKPANGESVTIETMHNIHVDIPLSLLKREASKTGTCTISVNRYFILISKISSYCNFKIQIFFAFQPKVQF